MTPMRLLVPLAAFACVMIGPLRAQERAWWVFFTDKGPGMESRLESMTAAELGLSQEALLRRAVQASVEVSPDASADEILRASRMQVFAKGDRSRSIVDVGDLPVHEPYLEAIRQEGVHIRVVSRWFNGVSVSCDAERAQAIARLPFVRAVEPVRRWKRGADPVFAKSASVETVVRPSSHELDYGLSLEQLEVINVPKIHDVWIDGTGIIVGMVDDGYRWRPHEAFQSVRVLGEYDFINQDTLTENEGDDPWSQDSHGTVTFSTLAGFREGKLVGPAFRASFYLAKTEIHDREIPVEEDYWAAGVEWLEAKGAAVVSSSLGYSIFEDSTGYRYENGDFDGQTAVTTRAAARAARLGIVVCTAMGNEGNVEGSIIAPADADSIVSVGAITMANTLAPFSSIGPTNDGRTKPDVVAPGVAVLCATKNADTTYARASGTSLATPLAAGSAALVRSARPELTPLQVRDALRNTADRASSPGNLFGWGKIDAWAALLYHGMVISTNPRVYWDGSRNTVAAYILSPSRSVDPSSIRLFARVEGVEFDPLPMVFQSAYPGLAQGSGLYTATLPILPSNALVEYFISASDGVETRMSPYGAPALRHRFRIGSGGAAASRLTLETSYPNPFEPGRHAAATISFGVPTPGAHVTLEVYDALGRRMALLADGPASAGWHKVVLPSQAAWPSGAYYCVLRTGGTVLVRGMTILR
ncbi:MAG: S8 family serine peptidase [Bacteroidota bacterium]|nr:S8 family serine peptidase [Bacteroidota bacterium]